MTAIQTQKLSKTYELGALKKRRVLALQSLDLSVEPGQVFGILGPNGAGKSTTIKILLNLIRPTSGSAKIFGFEPASNDARKLIGFLPENPAPYEYLTGVEFVTFCAQLAGLSGAHLTRRVGEVIDQVGMSDAKELQIRRYSKGMIQRISLAQSLVAEPRLLVLDEPTSGLDVLGRQLVREIVLDQRKRGTTILFCSHIIPDVEALCDHVAVLIGGKLIRSGTVSELLADDQALMEIVLENAQQSTLDPVKDKLTAIEDIGGRVVARFHEQHQHDVLGVAVAAKARVTSLRRSQFTLEELFVRALKESGRSVGSTIS